MNDLLVYSVKSAVYITIFYLIYYLLLSRDTSYARNRIYILGSVLLSFVLPFVTLYYPENEGMKQIGVWLNEVLITGRQQNVSNSGDPLSGFQGWQSLLTIYIIGMAGFILKLIADLLNLSILIIRHRKDGSNIIRFHSFNTAGFSAMGYIFLNSGLNAEEEREIIKHEENHLRRKHFIDIIFIGITRAFQWFNPVIYLFDRSLRAIHEYQADKECIESGLSVTGYQNLLLKQVLRIRSYSLTNSFSNPSLLRKRMIMMTRKQTPSLASLKVLFVLPAAILTLVAISAFEFSGKSTDKEVSAPLSTIEVIYGEDAYLNNTGDNKDVPFTVVDQMPRFKGGDVELLKYLAVNTRYPRASMEKNIQGRVIVRFCVNKNGSVDRISILKGVDPEIDAEAVRVVSTLPAFEPGRNNGIYVPVWYMVPITFALR